MAMGALPVRDAAIYADALRYAELLCDDKPPRDMA